jgi:DNA-binding CsgD family transcriptional regulator
MSRKELSLREEEIVDLGKQGLTNASIGDKFGISVGSVNTHWLRMRLKLVNAGRTDTAARIIEDRAEQGLRDSNVERQELETIISKQERGLIELRAALALLHMAMDQIRSIVWATDRELAIRIIANGEVPATHNGVVWDVGKTVYEIFKTQDKESPAIAAHLAGLDGKETNLQLTGEFSNMTLRVEPLRDEAGAVMGCISVVNMVGDREPVACAGK